MKLVTFHSGKKECLVNCNNITYIEPSVLDKDTTVIYFTREQPLAVEENYEEVKRRIQE